MSISTTGPIQSGNQSPLSSLQYNGDFVLSGSYTAETLLVGYSDPDSLQTNALQITNVQSENGRVDVSFSYWENPTTGEVIPVVSDIFVSPIINGVIEPVQISYTITDPDGNSLVVTREIPVDTDPAPGFFLQATQTIGGETNVFEGNSFAYEQDGFEPFGSDTYNLNLQTTSSYTFEREVEVDGETITEFGSGFDAYGKEVNGVFEQATIQEVTASNGTVSFVNGSWVYEANEGFFGFDSIAITYAVSDGSTVTNYTSVEVSEANGVPQVQPTETFAEYAIFSASKSLYGRTGQVSNSQFEVVGGFTPAQGFSGTFDADGNIVPSVDFETGEVEYFGEEFPTFDANRLSPQGAQATFSVDKYSPTGEYIETLDSVFGRYDKTQEFRFTASDIAALYEGQNLEVSDIGLFALDQETGKNFSTPGQFGETQADFVRFDEATGEYVLDFASAGVSELLEFVSIYYTVSDPSEPASAVRVQLLLNGDYSTTNDSIKFNIEKFAGATFNYDLSSRGVLGSADGLINPADNRDVIQVSGTDVLGKAVLGQDLVVSLDTVLGLFRADADENLQLAPLGIFPDTDNQNLFIQQPVRDEVTNTFTVSAAEIQSLYDQGVTTLFASVYAYTSQEEGTGSIEIPISIVELPAGAIAIEDLPAYLEENGPGLFERIGNSLIPREESTITGDADLRNLLYCTPDGIGNPLMGGPAIDFNGGNSSNNFGTPVTVTNPGYTVPDSVGNEIQDILDEYCVCLMDGNGNGSLIGKGVEGVDFLYANALPENRDNNAIKKRGEDSITGHYWVNNRDSSLDETFVDGGEYAVIMGRRDELTADITGQEIVDGLVSGDFVATKSFTSYGGYAVNAAFEDGAIDSLVQSTGGEFNQLMVGRVDVESGELVGGLKRISGTEVWENFSVANSLSGRNDNAFGDILEQQSQTGGF